MSDPHEPDSNREALRRFYRDAESNGDLAVIDDVFDPAVVLHSPFPGLPAGAEGLRQGVELLRAAFPDFTVTEDDSIAEGDKVVARCTVSGTHEGEFLGAPASGKSFSSQEIMIARFRDGLVVELWSVVDELSQREQLGWL
jgi:steroid delta-isomerase-like uncharacterized protein